MTSEMIYEWMRETLESKGYKVFEKGDYNVNLVAIRADDRRPLAFDDSLVCFYRVAREWRAHVWPCTTDPGTMLLHRPINPKGAAVLKPGQYRGSHRLGLHKGRPALVQASPVTVYRDNNRDDVIDYLDEDTGHFGINIHDASRYTIARNAETASAGCIVLANKLDMDSLLAVCKQSASVYGNSFTLTLIGQGDVETELFGGGHD